MANWLMVAFTAIIAVATVWYVVVTTRLWKETQRSTDAATASADAAKVSADAAKKSADIDAGLHRPYLGVSALHRQNDFNADTWAIWCCVKNYGTLPASGVRVTVILDREGRGSYGEGPLCKSIEILPQADFKGSLPISVNADTRSRLTSGDWAMIAHIRITYSATDGTLYAHNAEFVYDRTIQNFRVDESKTMEGRG